MIFLRSQKPANSKFHSLQFDIKGLATMMLVVATASWMARDDRSAGVMLLAYFAAFFAAIALCRPVPCRRMSAVLWGILSLLVGFLLNFSLSWLIWGPPVVLNWLSILCASAFPTYGVWLGASRPPRRRLLLFVTAIIAFMVAVALAVQAFRTADEQWAATLDGPADFVAVEYSYLNQRARGRDVRDSEPQLRRLRQLLGISHVVSLRLSVTNAESDLRHLSGLPYLNRLELRGLPCDDSHLSLLVRCLELEELLLVDTGVSGVGLQHLRAVPKLARIHIHGGQLKREAFEELSQLTSMNYICLDGIQIAVGGLSTLLDRPPGAPMFSLNLRSMELSDEAIGELAAANVLSQLTLYDTPISAKNLARLRIALPTCKIIAIARDQRSP